MGLFSKRKQTTARKPPSRLVAVSYRPFSFKGVPDASPGHWYVYKWAAPVEPHVGMRVVAPVGIGGLEPAIVVACDPPVPQGYTRATLSTISRVASKRELR